MIKTSSRNSHFGTRIQGIGTNYTHLCLIQPLLSQITIYPTTGEASSILSRKEIIATSLL